MASLSDWFKLGLAKPSGTDYEEHSAVGDVTNGRRFKAVQGVPMKVIIDKAASPTVYFGFAVPGTATSSALWRVMQKTVSNNVTTFKFADGDDLFDNIWDNRSSLSYPN